VFIERRDAARTSDLSACSNAIEREVLAAMVIAGVEVTIFEAEIEIAADRHVRAGNQLPGQFAIAAAELLDVGVAHAAAGIGAKAPVATEVDEAVKHCRIDAGMPAEVEVGRDEVGAGAGVQRCHERVVDRDVLVLRALVAELTLEPEHSEVKPADEVDVPAHFVALASHGCARYIGERRIREIDGPGDRLGLRPHYPAFYSDIWRMVGGRGRRDGHHECGGTRE